MKNPFPKIALYTASIIISSLPFTIAFAEAEDNVAGQPTSVVNNGRTDTRRRIQGEKSQQIISEASEVLTGTGLAIDALLKNDGKKATTILQSVSGKLDILLAKKPSMALIPADVEVTTQEFDGDEKTVKKALDAVDDLLDDGKIQVARQLLDQLVSEMDVTTTSIPLGVFPASIKKAAALIAAGKNQEAADILDETLNSLEIVTEVMPIPVLKAEEFLSVAAEMEHKKDLSKQAIRAEIANLADSAKNQLQLAVLLGYGNKDDYQPLYQAIDDMKSAIHSQASESAWNKIKTSLTALKNKLFVAKNNSK